MLETNKGYVFLTLAVPMALLALYLLVLVVRDIVIEARRTLRLRRSRSVFSRRQRRSLRRTAQLDAWRVTGGRNPSADNGCTVPACASCLLEKETAR